MDFDIRDNFIPKIKFKEPSTRVTKKFCPPFAMDDCFVFEEMRALDQLCDAMLVTSTENGDVSKGFSVHKVLLATYSGYFKALFSRHICDTATEKQTICITDITSDLLDLILQHIYRREPCVTQHNVEHLLSASIKLQCPTLREECCDFLSYNLTATNCVGIERFARHYDCTNLAEKARQCMLVNFHRVINESSDILEVGFEDLLSILSSSHLNAYCEEEVLETVIAWVEHDVMKRQRHFASLIQNVRLGLIHSDYFFEKVFKQSLITNNPDVLPYINKAWDFICDLDKHGNKNVDLQNRLVRPRIPHDVLFVVGGWSSGGPIGAFETYDTRADRWYLIKQCQDASRAYHSLVGLNKKIYAIGGFDGSTYFNTMRCFDPAEAAWYDAAPMHHERCYVAAAVLQGMIYSCGGYNGRSRMNDVERWDPANNQWTLITPMSQKRSDAGADALHNILYVAGGFDGDICLRSCETFDPVTDQWTIVNSMEKRRSGLGLITYDGDLYALGGFDGARRMASGERYSSVTKCWTPIPDMYTARSNFATVLMDNMVFVIGGFNGSYTIRHVECYDATSAQWYDATDMNINRSAVSACVISGLPNVTDYTYYGNMEQELANRIDENNNKIEEAPSIGIQSDDDDANSRDADARNGVDNEEQMEDLNANNNNNCHQDNESNESTIEDSDEDSATTSEHTTLMEDSDNVTGQNAAAEACNANIISIEIIHDHDHIGEMAVD